MSMIIFPVTGASETKKLVQNSAKKSGQPILIKFIALNWTAYTDCRLRPRSLSLQELPQPQKEAGHAPLSWQHLSPTDHFLKKSKPVPFTRQHLPVPQSDLLRHFPAHCSFPTGDLNTSLLQGRSHKCWLGNSQFSDLQLLKKNYLFINNRLS